MKRSALLMLLLAIATAEIASAQSDYSPFAYAGIRTIKTADAGQGYQRVFVEVSNSGDRPFNSNFECALLDSTGLPLAIARDAANSVPPKGSIITDTIVESKRAARTSCRIVLAVPSKD